MMYGDGWGWGGWLAMAVLMVVFWGLVIAGVIAVVHYARGGRPSGAAGWHGPAVPPGGQTGRARAEDLLHERFARGEIDEDEYRRRLALLREHS